MSKPDIFDLAREILRTPSRVFARSVVVAVGGDRRGGCWLLFEIPGGDWFYLDVCVLLDEDAPPVHVAVELDRAELYLAHLAPHGQPLTIEGRGDAIPRAAKAQVWSPPMPLGRRERNPHGRVAEADLPASIRAAVGG
jgi:hypothetical protein